MSDHKRGFKCLGADCPNHCCGAFNGINENLSIIGNRRFSDIILTDQDCDNLVAYGADEYIVEGENGLKRMRTLEDGTCTALEQGKCKIYPARPSLCQAFPLYLDMFGGVCCINECKGYNDQNCFVDDKKALENLLDIYQYWIDYYRKILF